MPHLNEMGLGTGGEGVRSAFRRKVVICDTRARFLEAVQPSFDAFECAVARFSGSGETYLS